MNATRAKLLAILLAGLIFRALLLPLLSNPGLHDPLHYHNLGRRLAAGQGFTIDYIWHYSRLPDEVVHPIDHWMPLAGLAAGLGIALAGEDGSPLLFLLAGALLPALAFLAGKRLRLDDGGCLIAAAFAAALPDLVWNSLRSDTTVLNALLLCGAVLLLQDGLAGGRRWRLLLAGALGGLAYLTRADSLLFLPLACCIVLLHIRLAHHTARTREAAWSLLLVVAGFALAAAPWLLRNMHTLGMAGSAETSRMFFMVEHHDHYAYGLPISLETMLQRQSPDQLLFKRGFEFLAAVKQITVSLVFPVTALLALGLYGLRDSRERERLLPAMPALLWTAGILLVYPLLLPLKSQAGSFEKAFLSVTPLLLPLAVFGLRRYCRRPLIQRLVIGLALFWLAAESVVQVRQESAFADRYHRSIGVAVAALDELPDLTGDGVKRVMTQDPYVFSHFGYQSIMMPQASREGALDLARRYAIDYLLLPAGRPSLDPLYLEREEDDRFALVAHLPEAGAKPYQFYRLARD